MSGVSAALKARSMQSRVGFPNGHGEGRGWAHYRYTKLAIYGEPDRIVAELTRARQRRSRLR